jgi:hypothetical protein
VREFVRKKTGTKNVGREKNLTASETRIELGNTSPTLYFLLKSSIPRYFNTAMYFIPLSTPVFVCFLRALPREFYRSLCLFFTSIIHDKKKQAGFEL